MEKTKHYYELLEFARKLATLPLRNTLTSREYDMIRYRYGLDDNVPHTLKETGREFGVTQERVRQLESRAFGKIRREVGF